MRELFLGWQRVVNGFELIEVDEEEALFVFRCTHFDWRTRKCGSYASRPFMCRDYPRALLDQPWPVLFDACGFRPIARNADQMRAALDLNATLADTISPGSEWVEFAGQRKHVMSYLNDFLFSPERANSPVRTLSGGERNRVLLARLFALPANVLVLDEPTNDLDIDTLELLEELLQSYKGTVFLVSHDRRFLDNVVTSTIVWEGDESPGQWREYEGGYEDWKMQRDRAHTLRAQAAKAARAKDTPPAAKSVAATPAPAAAKPRKLSYKEQRELDELPARIEKLEAEQVSLATLLADADAYTRDPKGVAAAQARVALIDDELLVAMERWEVLGQRG